MAAQVVAVVPFYGETDSDVDALVETIRSALSTPNVTDVLVVDDASPIAPALSIPRVTVFRSHKNRGPGPAINAAIGQAPDNALLCRLDCRDSWLPEKEQQIAETIGASFSWTLDPISGDVRKPDRRWSVRMRTDNQFASSGIVLSGRVWNMVGGYDAHLRWAEDWDLALRVQRAVGWAEFAKVTAIHGEHPGGLSDVSGNPQKAAARERDISIVRERARNYR